MDPDTLAKIYRRLGIAPAGGASSPRPSSGDHSAPIRPDTDAIPVATAVAEPKPAAPAGPPPADDPREVILKGELAFTPRAYERVLGPRSRKSPAATAEVLYRAVSFSVSTLAHLCLAIIAALFIFGVTADEETIVTIFATMKRGAPEPEPAAPPPEMVKQPEPQPEPEAKAPEPPPEPKPAETERTPPAPEATPPKEVPPVPGDTPKPSAEELARQHFEQGRSVESRAELARKYGGTEATESAVENGLEWLSRHQAETGEWDAEKFVLRCPKNDPCRSPTARGDPVYTPGVTGLAVLAYLGAGYSPRTEKHGKVVERALDYLMRLQHEDGGIDRPFGVNLYNHSVATLALTEAYLMTNDARYRRAAERAIAYLAQTQQPRGGWDYYKLDDPELQRNDTSITGWAVMAIRSAQLGEIDVPTDTIGRVKRLIESRTDSTTGELVYAERDPGANRRGTGLMAVGMLCRMYLGMDDPEPIRLGAQRLLKNLPIWSRLEEAIRRGSRTHGFNTEQNMYTWFYGTLAMFQLGGENWRTWNRALRDTLVGKQYRHTHKKGSWDPEANYLGREGGRVWSTAINVLNLEIYYRYLPLYVLHPPGSVKVPPAEATPEELLDKLQRGSKEVQIQVMAELAERRPEPRAVEAIAAKLDDPDVRICLAALRALARMGARDPLPRMIKVARDEPSELKGAMLEALGAYRDPTAIDLFIESLGDLRERVTQGALHALRQVSGHDFGRDAAAWRTWADQQRRPPEDR